MAAQANKFATPGYAYTLPGELESYTLPGSEDLSRKFEQLLQEGERTSNELLSTLPLSRYSSTLSAPPFPSLAKNQFTSSASLSSGSSSTCRQNAPVSGSAEKFSLPHIVAHFDESPWVWRSADTSPLKLSDMQPRLLTPESIRRQRSHCVRLVDKNNPSTSPTHSCSSSGQSRGTCNSTDLFNLTQSTLRSNATIKPRNHAVSLSQEAEGVAWGQVPDSPTRRQLELTSRTDSNALISCNSVFGQSSEPASLAASCTDGSLLTATRLRFSSIASYDTIKLGADSCSNTTSTRIRGSVKALTEAEKCVAPLPHFNQSPHTTWLKPPFLVMEKVEDGGVTSNLNVSAVSAGLLSERQSAHSTSQSVSEVPAETRSPVSSHNAYFDETSEHRQSLLPRRNLADAEQQKRKRQHSRSKFDSSFVVTNQGDFSDTGASDSICFEERASQKTDRLSRRRRHSFATDHLSTSPFPQRTKSLSSDDTRSISSTIDPKTHQRALSYGPSVNQSELAQRLAFVPPAALNCRNKTPFVSRQNSSVSRVEIADAASARPTSSSATTVDFAQTERDNLEVGEPCLAFQKKQNVNNAFLEADSLDLSLSNAQKSSIMSFSLRDSPYATSHSTGFVPADHTPSCIAIEVARLRRLCRQKVNRAGRRTLRDSAFGSPEDAGTSKTPFGSSDATPSQVQTGTSDFTSGPRLFEQSGSVKTKRAYASSGTFTSNPEIIQRPSTRHYVDSKMRSTLNFQGRELTISNSAAPAPVIERQLSKTPMPSHTSASASSASSVVTRQEYERLMERTYSGINTDTSRSTFVGTAAAEKITTHGPENTVVMKSFNQDGHCFKSLPMNHSNINRQDAYLNASSIAASSKLSCANNASSENIVTQGKSDANTVAKESVTLQNETKMFSKTDLDTTSQNCFEIPTMLTATASNVDGSASHLTEISMSVPTSTSNLPSSFDTLNSTIAYDTPTPMTSDNGIVTTTASACFPSSSFSFELTAADFNTGENTLHFSNLATPYAIVYKAQKDKKTFAQGPTPDPHFSSGCIDRRQFVNRRLPQHNLFHWRSSPSVYEKQSSGRDSRLTLRQEPYVDFLLAQSHQEDDDLITPYPVRDSNNVSVGALKPLSPVQSDGAKKSPSLVPSELNCSEEQHRTVQNASPPTAQETTFDNSHHDPQPKKRHYGWRLRRPRPYVVLNVLRRTRYPLIALRQEKRSATRGSSPKVQASNAILDKVKPGYTGDNTASAQLSPNKTEFTKPNMKSSYVTSSSKANAHVNNEGLVLAAEKVSTADEPHSLPGSPFTLKNHETNKKQTRNGCDSRNGTSSTSLPCSSHLSAQWLRLNQKLREHGISKIGVPILDSDISRVYGDAFVQLDAEKSNKTCNQNMEFLNSTKLRLLPQNSSKNASLDISLVTQNDMAQHRIDTAAPKEQRTQDGVSVLQPVGTKTVKNDNQKNVNDSLELQDENFPAPYDDTIALLLANIDIVKMLDLWNKTLDELTKYRQYCSDLYQFEGSHLRIFQQNDTLKKENDALKAKVCSLERLLQQSRTSEVEHWESQVDYQQMEIEKERLMKTLKEERQKMKVLIVQKRQSDIAVNNLKQQIHRLLEKENRIRIKAKTVLEKVARGLRPTSSHNAQGAAANCRAAAAGGAPGSTTYARQSNSRGASFSAIASDGSRQLPKLNAETCVNQGVVELVWYYEEQLDTLNLEKGELSNAVMSAKKTLRRHGLSPNLRSRQGRLSTEQQSSTGLLPVDENAKKQSPEKDRQNLSSLVPFTETLTTTATTACSKHVPQDTTLSATDACEARKTFAVECKSCPAQPIQPMSANAASPPRWILSELHAQLKSTIEEKTKNELRYQDEIDHLREALKRATSPLSESHINDCNVTSQTVSENGSVERNCESIITGFSGGLGTRELIRRDKKLFRAGLQERLKELERKGRLFNLLESSCRSLSLDDPQRLPEVADRLVAAVSVTKQLQCFVQNVSRILGASFLYEQHKFAEIERLLYKWRDALVHMDIVAALHRNFAALLERVVACTHTTLGASLVDALRTGVKQALKSTIHLRDANEKQLNEVLALALSALERQQNTTTDTPPCVLEAKSASAQPIVENCVNETLIESQQFLANATTQTLQDILLYFMQVFKVPTLELCRPAVDRLHLKIKEHIRFYRGVVTVLNVPLDTPPSEILKHIAHINNRASTTHDMIKEQVYRELLESSHISLPMKEVKHLFKVFRAIQVRLSLPDVPSTCLGDLFVMAGDEGIVEDPVLEQHNSRQALTTATELHSTDEGCCDTYKEPTGLLVSSSSSSGSLLSSSITGERLSSWKKWAKVCLFTVDLMARMVEQSRWAMVPNAYRSRDIFGHNGLPHAQCSGAGAAMRPCVK